MSAMDPEKIKASMASSQTRYRKKRGFPPVDLVSVDDFEAGEPGVPDIKAEFGYFPTSILVLTRNPDLSSFLNDNDRPARQMGKARPGFSNFSHKASIFPPAAAWFCLKYWSAPGDVFLDPFGNRANIGLIANYLGRLVVLNDIVPRYCDLMRRAGRRRPRKDLRWRVLNRDAADLATIKDNSIDFVLTGPPYYNLEKYEDVPGQASSMRSYANFLVWYQRVAQEIFRVIRAGKFCAFKVANWRKGGRLVLFVSHTLAAFQEVGWVLHDELICAEPAPLGLGFNWHIKLKQKYVHKAHQTILVFRKPG
ncbi:MAG: hypothetical protein JRI72_15720 [Deltaproteobacteria bacterium]|nr:hypothetical protein [Deltaproteobacteria bacterium]